MSSSERIANFSDILPSLVPEDINHANGAVVFYKNKEKPNQRFVLICGVLVEVLPNSDDEQVKHHTWDWKEVGKGVMLDESTLLLLRDIALRYNRKQPMIIEGPPAVSKTFAIWVFSSLINAPYVRIQFSSGTKPRALQGGKAFSNEKTLKRSSITEFLQSTALALIAQDNAYVEKLRTKLLRILSERGEAAIDQHDLEDLADIAGLEAFETKTIDWEDTELIWGLQHGAIIALDEPNLPEDSATVEALNSVTEVTTGKLYIAGRNEPVENAGAFFVRAQNPENVRGRKPTSDAVKSRHEARTVSPMSQQFIIDLMRFFIKGQEPSARIENISYQGRHEIKTRYRGLLEKMPMLDEVIKALAHFHMAMVSLTEKRKIGLKSKDGGSYVFDQRKIVALLDALMVIANGGVLVSTASGLEPIIKPNGNGNWSYALRSAITQVYLDGVQPVDKATVASLMEKLPVWPRLAKYDQRPDGQPITSPILLNASPTVNVESDSGGKWRISLATLRDITTNPSLVHNLTWFLGLINEGKIKAPRLIAHLEMQELQDDYYDIEATDSYGHLACQTIFGDREINANNYYASAIPIMRVVANTNPTDG